MWGERKQYVQLTLASARLGSNQGLASKHLNFLDLKDAVPRVDAYNPKHRKHEDYETHCHMLQLPGRS